MAWAYFQNQAAFSAYSDAVCADQGIPQPGRIVATGAPAILNAWTDAWVLPIQIKSTGNVTTWGAHIPDSHLVTYAALLGLTSPDSAVTFNVGTNGLPDGTVTIQGRGTFTLAPNTLNYRKTKPATYTMTDAQGVSHVYDTTSGAIIG